MSGSSRKAAQTELPLPKPKGSWGGRREGAGRPRIKGRRVSEHHKARPAVRPSEPIHVITRIVRGFDSLRKRHMYAALREATIAAAKHEDARIVQLSIQGTHLHALVEAQNRGALSRLMKAFLGAAAKQIHRVIARRTGTPSRGRVFADRFHMRILETPREVRNALAYVLNNWRRHKEDSKRFAVTWRLDPYSSAWSFDGWKERREPVIRYAQLPPGYQGLITWLPRSWLMRVGWRKHGLISVYEVPGPLALQ